MRVVGRTQDFAEGLPSDAFEIVKPRFVGEVIAHAIINQLMVRELILPFDVKGLAPECVFAFDVDSHALIHCPSLPQQT